MYSVIRKPKNGERIKITFLPKNNAAPNPNCYIGSTGVVEESDADGFVLRYDSGSSLIVINHCHYNIEKTLEVKN